MKQRTRLLHDDLMGFNVGNNKKTDGEDNSEIQLHKMRTPEHFIEAQIQEGDTLQAIALRFHCPISELKRINHIDKDNEIFARRTIKVPVTPYSVLTEIHQTNPTPSTSSQVHTNPLIHKILENNNHNEISQGISEPKEKDCSIDCNAIVLNSTLSPAVISYTDVDTIESVTEDTQLLPNKHKDPVEAVVVKELTSHGADFGLKWFHLVCFMLILGVVTPLVYVLFYLDKPEHSDVSPLHIPDV